MTDFSIGDIIMFWRKWLGTKKASLEGRWSGPGRIALLEPSVNFQDPEPSDAGRAGRVIRVIHGAILLRCHPTQLRRASAREIQFGFDQGGIPRQMPHTVDDVMSLLRNGGYQDITADRPPPEDLQ